MFQHTAARRRLHVPPPLTAEAEKVSTHSRAEAAASDFPAHFRIISSFNTQPRGGGCDYAVFHDLRLLVSTHSRAEAAAFTIKSPRCRKNCFNTQPRGGGCIVDSILLKISQCFNTQPPEGGCQRSL